MYNFGVIISNFNNLRNTSYETVLLRVILSGAAPPCKGERKNQPLPRSRTPKGRRQAGSRHSSKDDSCKNEWIHPFCLFVSNLISRVLLPILYQTPPRKASVFGIFSGFFSQHHVIFTLKGYTQTILWGDCQSFPEEKESFYVRRQKIGSHGL